MIRISLNCLNWALYYIFALALIALRVKKKISKVTPNPYHSERNIKADQVSWNDLQFSKFAISAPKFNKFECLDSYFINTYRKSCYFPILFIARAKVFRFWFICMVRVWTMINKLMINLLEEARRPRSEGRDLTEYVIELLLWEGVHYVTLTAS